jgi:hypothetical protein
VKHSCITLICGPSTISMMVKVTPLALFNSTNIIHTTTFVSRRLNLNATENRSGNLEWSIKRYRQYWAHKTQDEDIQNKITRHR